MRNASIKGVGVYRPVREVSNAEVALGLGMTAEWVKARCGIDARRYAGRAETLELMAASAAADALAQAGVDAGRVDCVLVATCTNPRQLPAIAPGVAHRIGARTAAAFDLAAACAGFCYGLGVADAMVRAAVADLVLVIGAERATDIIDPTDRNHGFLFGDGAGAVTVGADRQWGIGPVIWGADGGQAQVLSMTATWQELAADPMMAAPTLVMDGRQLVRWIRSDVVPIAGRALSAAGLDWGSIRALIPHQGNARITRILASELHLPEHVVVADDIVTAGNTSSASVPLAMAAMIEHRQVRSGDLALTLGYGAGLTYAAQVIRIP